MYLHRLGNEEKKAFLDFARLLARQDDQRLDALEDSMLDYMCAEMCMSRDVPEGEPFDVSRAAQVLSSDEARRIFVIEAFNICLANGLLHGKQRHLIHQVAESLSLPDAFLSQAEAVARKKSEIMMEFDRLVTP